MALTKTAALTGDATDGSITTQVVDNAQPKGRVRSNHRAPAPPLGDTLAARERLTARIDRDRREDKTGLIYMVLLGGAACLALSGVVRTAMVEPATGPDAPPPAVFVQTD